MRSPSQCSRLGGASLALPIILIPAATAAAVDISGDLMGGQGRFGPTIAGGAIGGVGLGSLGIAWTVVAARRANDGLAALGPLVVTLFVLAPTGLIAGSITGYSISDRRAAKADMVAPEDPTPRPRASWYVLPTRGGASAGLGWQF